MKQKKNHSTVGSQFIHIQGAREHNLKNISLSIPRDSFVVITGLSGSGKSSLAFDTIYAEGQRRYVESLSAYARQFLGQLEKPDVDSIEGLSPAIAIEQKSTHNNPRSTVGTVTEIYDYLRLLYARIGHPYCSECNRRIESQSIDQIVSDILLIPSGTKIQILSPIVQDKKGEHQEIITKSLKEGFIRLRVDGTFYSLSDNPEIRLAKTKKHNIDIVIDRLVIKEGIRSRLTDSVETALNHSKGILTVLRQEPTINSFSTNSGNKSLTMEDNWLEKIYSTSLYCPYCQLSFTQLEPRSFSFNSPHGACPECDGLGVIMDYDPELIVPDVSLSLSEGAVKAWSTPPLAPWYQAIIDAMVRRYKFNPDVPWCKLKADIREKFLYGTGEDKLTFHFEKESGKFDFHKPYEGVIPNLRRRYRETKSEDMRKEFNKFINPRICERCHGKRLAPFPAAVRLADKVTIGEITKMSIDTALDFFNNLALSEYEKNIAQEIVKEIINRLRFLHNVGLNYLTLDRSAGTLSGGEAQRIRLATQIGSQLMGVLYVLDEPSIGLHQRDNDRLLATLRELTKLGNTVLVVEHDRDTIMAADHVIDLGPGAGLHGGEIVAEGTPADILSAVNSLTGNYLSGQKKIETPHKRRKDQGKFIRITGAEENNLKSINVDIPLHVFVAVTGVSGSGKSSLIKEILYKKSAQVLNRAQMKPGRFKKIEGLEHLDKVIDIDQSPIGRTPRSNPATYTGIFTPIRDLFAELPEAKLRGYKPGRFSFNVSGGRCESCEGDGIKKIEMHFLPDIYVTCEVCNGKRYNHETLEVRYKGKNIYDVLQMNVEEAGEFFSPIPAIWSKLDLLKEVGLGYIQLGQPATTLSGGEAQRIKLAGELAKRSTGRTLYILDEPTTGLHFEDIKKLLYVLDRLVDQGNSVIVIEHNLDVIKHADYLIDLGPEGGIGGGQIICVGTPESVANVKESFTGQYLKKVLGEWKKNI